MKASLIFKQALDDDYKKIVIFMGAENVLPADKLPKSYSATGGYVDIDAAGTLMFKGKDVETMSIAIGAELTVEMMNEYLKMFEVSGQKLDKIMSELRDAQANWNGRVIEHIVNEKKDGFIASVFKFFHIIK